MQADTAPPVSRTGSKLVPAFVLIVAILPIAASFLLYLSDWRPSATVNHGQLVTPPRPVGNYVLHDANGKPAKLGDLHGKWIMLYADSVSCPAACIEKLYLMRQTHTAQGKERERVERVFIVAEGSATPELEARLADYPGMHLWTADAASLSAMAANFDMAPQELAQQRNLYLIDPMGNFFMRYAPDLDPAGLRKDLERLLKYSGAG